MFEECLTRPPRWIRNSVPKYDLHKPSGQARVRSRGQTFWLGKHNTPESLAEYARICAELQAKNGPKTGSPANRRPTVEVLVLAFMQHTRSHYRGSNGRLTSEFREYSRSVVHLRALYGHTPIADFGPRAFQTVRDAMVKADWCRSVVNKRTNRVRSIFR